MKTLIKIFSVSLLLIAVHIILAQDAQIPNSNTCRACNCQFSNVQVLTQLVEATIRDYLIDEPSMLNVPPVTGLFCHILCHVEICTLSASLKYGVT